MVDTLPATMARPKQPETENVRVARAIMAKVRVIAARRGISAPEYLNEKLGPVVEADYDAALAAMAKERAAESKRRS